MKIKILGSGCAKCKQQEKTVRQALVNLNMEADVEKVEDVQEIMKYGIMSTPAVVIDEQVVSYGKVLKAAEVEKLLSKGK